MIRSDKFITLFYVILGVSFFIFILNSTDDLGDNIISVLPTKTTDFEIRSIIDVDKKTLFDLMANIEIYPNILSKNISNIHILNQTDNEIIAEEEFKELGIKTKLIVKHTLTPYDKHVMEVIDGDAKGTIITQLFNDFESGTELTTQVHLNLIGANSIISYLPKSNLIHATNTVISSFVEYSKRDIFENKVNLLYIEILHRPADVDGLLHFSSLLKSGKISEDDLREELLNSPERKTMDFKSVNELNDQTKKTIDDLYEKILLRKADSIGMHHFGNLLEHGMSTDEIRNELLLSDEGKNISVFHPIRTDIKRLIVTIYDRSATFDEINYYHKLVDNGTMNLSDIENELKQTKD
jgi:ribosome-associated toxin RatA of RatAB toxin-antitoxin module